jgi:hypothetical protein
MVVEEIIKRRVIQLWLSVEARDKIAADNNIGAGTVSAIIDDYKTGLDHLDLDSFRELMVEAKKRSMTPCDLASHFRLFNYLVKSGAAEDKIESFITNINSGYISLEKVIELVNQLYELSRGDSISPDQLPNYIKQKLVEKQKIDEQIQEVNAVLQTKNVKAKAINEYTKVNERLSKHGLSTADINKLVKLVVNAKRYDFDVKKFVGKLSNIKEIERKKGDLEAIVSYSQRR